jgi:prolyl-tRNA synthetase
VIKYRTGSNSDSKITIPLSDTVSIITSGLEIYQQELYTRAKQRLQDGINISTNITYDQMKNLLVNDEASTYPGVGLFLVPWKCNADNEQTIKEECKATIRCYPLEHQSKLLPGAKCFYSGDEATHMALFGRAF